MSGRNEMGLLDKQAQQIEANEWSATPAQSTGYKATQYTNAPTLKANQYTNTPNLNAVNYTNTPNLNSINYTNTPTLEAAKYTADKASAAKFDMNTPDSTGRNGVVEDRLNNMINKDSEYMQLAKANAQRNMSAKGLGNSSLAIGANYAAGISAALPIAQQDASAFNEIGMSNTNAENQFRLANQSAENRARSENTAAENAANTWNATAKDTANKLNQQYQNEAAMWNANAKDSANKLNQQYQNEAAMWNANAKDSANKLNQQYSNEAAMWNANAQDSANKLNQQYQNEADRFAADAANQFALSNKQSIDQASRDFAAAQNEASMQNAANNLQLLLSSAQDEISKYQTDTQRKTALDNIASSLVQSGLNSGVFATQKGAANWIKMIGQMYPEMGLSVTTQLATTASQGVK